MRHRIVAGLVILALLGGCTRVVIIPPEAYADLDGPAAFLVTTTRDEVFNAEQLRVDGDELVIVRLSSSDRRWKQVDPPITMPLTSVVSIEKRESEGLKSIAVVTGTALVAFLFLAFVYPATYDS